MEEAVTLRHWEGHMARVQPNAGEPAPVSTPMQTKPCGRVRRRGWAAGEDMWHVYNLVRAGDHVTATTFRKVQRDLGAGTESERVKLKLTIAVESVDFDPEGEYLHTMRRTCDKRLAGGDKELSRVLVRHRKHMVCGGALVVLMC